MSSRLVVINPNSTRAATRSIAEAVAVFGNDQTTIDCLTIDSGPPSIEKQRDVDRVVPHVLERIVAEAPSAAGFVIACYSDPGVFAARELVDVPVFGVAQATLGFAASMGAAIGVVTLRPASAARHMAYARALGLSQRIVAARAAQVSVVDLMEDQAVGRRMLACAEQLVLQDGADLVVLGCCGMSRFRQEIEDVLGVPVLDPTQVAVGAALTAIRASYRTPPLGGARA